MRMPTTLASFASKRPVKVAALITLVLVSVHILINAVGVAIAAKQTADLGVQFITAEWTAKAALFVVGLPLLLWAIAWAIAFFVFLVWERRAAQSVASPD